MNTTQFLNASPARHHLTDQQFKSKRGLHASNRRFRRAGIMPDQIAAIAHGCRKSPDCGPMVCTSMPQAQEQQQESLPAFCIQREVEGTFQEIPSGDCRADRARDLQAKACEIARELPGTKVRVIRRGGSRAVLCYIWRKDAAGKWYLGSY